MHVLDCRLVVVVLCFQKKVSEVLIGAQLVEVGSGEHFIQTSCELVVYILLARGSEVVEILRLKATYY